MSSQARKIVGYTWFANLILVLLLFLIAIVLAAANDQDRNGSDAASFCAILTALLCFGVCFVGTMILRLFQDHLGIGFLLGMTAMMSQTMLVNFAYFLGKSKESSTDKEKNADRTMSAFSFLLMLNYALFTAVLYKYKDQVFRKLAYNRRGSLIENDGLEMKPMVSGSNLH